MDDVQDALRPTTIGALSSPVAIESAQCLMPLKDKLVPGVDPFSHIEIKTMPDYEAPILEDGTLTVTNGSLVARHWNHCLVLSDHDVVVWVYTTYHMSNEVKDAFFYRLGSPWEPLTDPEEIEVITNLTLLAYG